MLKFKLEKLDGLTEEQKALYKEKDGAYYLQIEGMPEDKSAEYEERITKMDAKINELLNEKKSEGEKRKAAEEKARKEAEELAKKNGDIEALEASWSEKMQKAIDAVKAEYEPKNAELDKLLRTATIEATASKLASEIAVPGAAKVLLPHIQSRLAMEIKDGKAVTVVRDANGKASALTLEELKNEYIGDEAFSHIITGSKATGGGANNSSGGAGGGKTMKRADFVQKDPSAQMAFVNEGGTIID